MKTLLLSVSVVFCVALWEACTIEVKTGKPEVHIDCVLVELPGGRVVEDCDGGLSYGEVKDASEGP